MTMIGRFGFSMPMPTAVVTGARAERVSEKTNTRQASSIVVAVVVAVWPMSGLIGPAPVGRRARFGVLRRKGGRKAEQTASVEIRAQIEGAVGKIKARGFFNL